MHLTMYIAHPYVMNVFSAAIMLVTNGTGPVLIIGGKLEIISLRPNSKLNRPQTLTIRLFRLFCPDLGADQSIFSRLLSDVHFNQSHFSWAAACFAFSRSGLLSSFNDPLSLSPLLSGNGARGSEISSSFCFWCCWNFVAGARRHLNELQTF